MESIEDTIQKNFGEKTKFRRKEVREIIKERDELHKNHSQNLLAGISLLMVICFFLIYMVIMLW